MCTAPWLEHYKVVFFTHEAAPLLPLFPWEPVSKAVMASARAEVVSCGIRSPGGTWDGPRGYAQRLREAARGGGTER